LHFRAVFLPEGGKREPPMSKAKKAAYAEKQKTAAATAAARELTPLGEPSAAPAAVKKPKGRKQSRGK
jgi:hypothetical protein